MCSGILLDKSVSGQLLAPGRSYKRFEEKIQAISGHIYPSFLHKSQLLALCKKLGKKLLKKKLKVTVFG
jgi:hypothetical protein